MDGFESEIKKLHERLDVDIEKAYERRKQLVEEYIEKALVDGFRGVKIVEAGLDFVISLSYRVPYGEIHWFRS